MNGDVTGDVCKEKFFGRDLVFWIWVSDLFPIPRGIKW